MAINGYLVYNITQKHQKIFLTQIEAFKKAFKAEKVTIKPIDNLSMLKVIKSNPKIDFVLFWDKDVALIHQLVAKGIKVFNNLDAIALCDDKAFTYAKLLKHKVATPKTLVLPLTFFESLSIYFNDIKKLIKDAHIKYPFVVKERSSSLGLGVYLIHNDLELKKVLKDKWERGLIIQEYINYEVGKDYRVYLINHQVAASLTRVNLRDFRSNVERGGVMKINKNTDSKLLELAIKASKAVKLDFGAVDIVKNHKNEYLVLEINSNARTARIDQLNKKPITKLIAKYILKQI